MFRLRVVASAAVAGVVAVTGLTGCSGGPGLTTGSLFAAEPAKAKAHDDNNTPTGRALHVGRVAARATKCGYNFDAAALRTNYLAAEAATGLAVSDLQKVQTIYDTGYRAVMNVTAAEPEYCSRGRTETIKAQLTKVLAADYSPPPIKKETDTGVLGGFFDQDVVGESGPQFGTDDWWQKQQEAAR